MTTASLIRHVPLFDGLDTQSLDDVLRIFERVEFSAGDHLTRQGYPADCAYIVESGSADVVTALPGGGTATVAQLQPGAMLGEMALLESGMCSATVIAREAMVSYRITREGFRMLLAQRVPAVFTIQQRIIRALCQRLRTLNAKVVAADVEDPAVSDLQPVALATHPVDESFDVPAFLPMLTPFREFAPTDIVALHAASSVMHIRRGELLFGQGAAGDTAYIVVRGALELTVRRGGELQRIGILGPGRFCGILALIEDQAHSMQAAAREHTTLLALDRAAFMRFFSGHDAPALKLQQAINRELLQALSRTNNHLTRLISSMQVRGRSVAADLQKALATQDCRAA